MKKSTGIGALFYLLWAAGVGLYFWLTITAPVTNNVYNLSHAKLLGIQLSFIVPIALIWLAATYGAVRFNSYASSISASPDGKALNTISFGLLVLVSSLLESSVVGTLRVHFQNAGHLAGFTIAQNYVQIVLNLVAFYLIYRGSSKLIPIVKGVGRQAEGLRKSLVPLVFLAGFYAWSLHALPTRNFVTNTSQGNSYFLSDGWIFLSIVLPYLGIWVLGALSAINIRIYQAEAKGTIYRQALSSLANGVFAVIVASVFIQLITAVGAVFKGWSLGAILGLVYLIIIVWATGYVMIASGARKLAKIEEAV